MGRPHLNDTRAQSDPEFDFTIASGGNGTRLPLRLSDKDKGRIKSCVTGRYEPIKLGSFLRMKFNNPGSRKFVLFGPVVIVEQDPFVLIFFFDFAPSHFSVFHNLLSAKIVIFFPGLPYRLPSSRSMNAANSARSSCDDRNSRIPRSLCRPLHTCALPAEAACKRADA